MKKLGVAALLALPLFAAACSGGGDAEPPPKPVYPPTINIRGDLTLAGATYVRGNLSDCAGAGPYADIYKGGAVTVSDQVGRPLAIGKVEYGVGTNVYRNRLDECTFRFRVVNVPRATSYQIAVGRQAPQAWDFVSLYRYGGQVQMKLPLVPPTTTTTILVTPG